VIIVSFIAFAVMIAIVVSAMLNTQQQQVKNLSRTSSTASTTPRIPPATSAWRRPISSIHGHATHAPGSFVRARR